MEVTSGVRVWCLRIILWMKVIVFLYISIFDCRLWTIHGSCHVTYKYIYIS